MTRYDMDPVWLGFRDPEVETAWRADLAQGVLSYLRPAVLVIASLFFVFVAHDVLLYPQVLGQLLAVRLAVVVPLLATWGLLGTARGARFARVWVHEVVLALATLMCVGMFALSLVLLPHVSERGLWFATLGFELALFGVYGVARLRFGHAVAIGVVTTLCALTLLDRAHQGSLATWVAPFGLIMNVTGAWVTRSLELLGRRAFVERARLSEARARSEALLRNALPDAVAARLQASPAPRALEASRHDDVTVVLADLVGFTPLCERLPPEVIAHLLDGLFRRFDICCERHGVEKVKTLGDAWLAVAGALEPREDHAEAAARLALDLVAASDRLPLRIGLGSGPAVAGVVGRTRFAWDVWGEAVDEAAAMERASAPGRIRLTDALAARLGRSFVVTRDADGWWLVGERAGG